MTAETAVPLTWPDEVDEILAGDLVVVVGSPTPRGGVVLNSVTPLGLRDREAGTVTFTSSLGFGRKLERIAADPRIAVAYHTRRHGHSDRPGLVVVQGTASINDSFTEAERQEVTRQAADHIGQVVEGRFWDWWLQVYYRDRVGIDVQAERILWWPSGTPGEDPVVLGRPLADTPPPSQPPPRDATAPRVPMDKVARALRLDHQLIGVLLDDGMPLLLPATVTAKDQRGIVVANPGGLLPPGGRRAGFIGHTFRPKLVGLTTATHTGWLEVGDDARWTPHSRHGFTAPPNKTLLLLGNGAAARWGYRQAIKQGRDEILRHARRA